MMKLHCGLADCEICFGPPLEWDESKCACRSEPGSSREHRGAYCKEFEQQQDKLIFERWQHLASHPTP